MYKEMAIMWKNKENYVDYDGVFGLSIIKHVTLQKIVVHDFRYDPRNTEFVSPPPHKLAHRCVCFHC